MNFLKHMTENLFITFTGIAALVHSTWSLGTMFSGVMPESDWVKLAWWGVPAFFVAFAMDIGQISTSADIRHKGLTWQRGLTFFVFAIATYYLQFLYIAHHMPALEIASGVSDFHRWTVVTARDASIWILPLLLPLATMLYTISDGDSQKEAKEKRHEKPIEAKENVLPANLNEIPEIIQEPVYVAFCEDCQWTKEYESADSMNRGLNTHKSVHCTAKKKNDKIDDIKNQREEGKGIVLIHPLDLISND